MVKGQQEYEAPHSPAGGGAPAIDPGTTMPGNMAESLVDRDGEKALCVSNECVAKRLGMGHNKILMYLMKL